MTASTHETASRRDHSGADVDAEVTQRVILAGLTLERTAAAAGDPLVRRNIEKVLDDLDQVVQIVRAADFGTEHHLNPGGLGKHPAPMPRDRDELVHYWLDQGESALDLALAALTRVVELDGSHPSGLGILHDKLAILATLTNGRLQRTELFPHGALRVLSPLLRRVMRRSWEQDLWAIKTIIER